LQKNVIETNSLGLGDLFLELKLLDKLLPLNREIRKDIEATPGIACYDEK